MVSLILIGEPKSLHIPVMAMQVKSNRESSWSYPTASSPSLDLLIGGNASRWIKQKQKTHSIKRIVTRNYIPLQTAFYAHWLVFFEPVVAQEFLQAFPQSDTERTVTKLEADLQSLSEKVESKLSKGAYDLSRYPSDQRRAAAVRFIEFDDQIRSIKERLQEMARAQDVRDEWRARIEIEQSGR